MTKQGVERAELIREIVAHCPAVFLRIDAVEGRWEFTYISETVTQFGYRPGDFLAGRLNLADFVHPDDYPLLMQQVFETAAAEEQFFQTQYRIFTAQQETVWVQGFVTPVRDAEGRLCYMDSCFFNLEHVKNAPAGLLEKARQQTVLDHVPTFIHVTDLAMQQILFANQAFRHSFGEENEALCTSPMHKAVREYCRNCPLFLEKGNNCVPHSFELYVPEQDIWLGVQCNVIPWVNRQSVRLFCAQDISGQKRNEEYIRRIAFMDHLTGLPNRYRCDIDLQIAVDEAKASGRMGYVIFTDMDDFKIVNDGYGHDYGDALLVEFANYLKEEYQDCCQVFRFGGDEFVILLSPAHADRIDEMVTKLLERARLPWPANDKSFYCTLSLGVVRFPDGDMGVKEIIKNADIAMYEAKKIGKNRCCYYNDSMRNESIERAEMESMLREAIANHFKGFDVYYQPYLDLDSRQVFGAKALLRWFSPNGRLIMPEDFIPLSEYLGLIVPLGEFVLNHAAKTLRQVQDAGLPGFTISVNLSVCQLQQPNIVPRIEQILAEAGVSAEHLVFDMTEGITTANFGRIVTVCEALHAKGSQIAMDDFGIGHSSLRNLRDLPIGIIKVDRSFIHDITKDAYANAFVRLITDLGHTLGQQICITGVETEAQLSYCQSAGADSVQGFYFYKPMPAAELLKELGCKKASKQAMS